MITRLSKSQVSAMAKDLDAQVEAFRNRPLDAGPIVRRGRADAEGPGGRPDRERHALLATGVNAEGTGRSWASGHLRRGRRRLAGLPARPGRPRPIGRALVTSDAHRGLVEAIGAALPGAAWQRCRTH